MTQLYVKTFLAGLLLTLGTGCASEKKESVDIQVPIVKVPKREKGGQPGSIILRGKAASESNPIDSDIFGGVGADGKNVIADESLLVRSESLTSEAVKSLGTLEFHNDYIIMGCENSEQFSGMISGKEAMTEEVRKVSEDTGIVYADTVIICNELPKRVLGLDVTAKRVVLLNVTAEVSSLGQKLSIVTQELELHGTNSFKSVGSYLVFDPIPGPTIRIEVAQKVSAGHPGFLSIDSYGASVETKTK